MIKGHIRRASRLFLAAVVVWLTIPGATAGASSTTPAAASAGPTGATSAGPTGAAAGCATTGAAGEGAATP